MEPDWEPLERSLERALSSGADDAEAFLERDLGLTIKVFDRKVEKFSYSEGRGLGLRLFKGARSGRAYTSDLGERSISECVDAALSAARVSPEDPHAGLPPPELYPAGSRDGSLLGEDLGIWSDDLEAVPASEKIEFTLDLERLARAHDSRVRGVETAAYGESSQEVSLLNSRGLRAASRSSVCYGYLMAIADGKGDSQTGFGFTAGRSFRSLDASEASREAASTAVALLGAGQVRSARVLVLLDNLSAAELLAALGIGLSGESVVTGRSFLAGKLGESVASELVDVVDDGLLPGGFGTSPFDGEGTRTSRKRVIERGVLITYLHNCNTASRMGVSTTGNAARGSYRGKVGVSATNLMIAPGDMSPGELRSSMDVGFEVKEVQGAHAGLNQVTGEVSVGAKGLWVERGRPVRPIREVTLAGTMEGILKGIAAVGRDMRFTPLLGGIGAPSILVEGLTVGGG